MEHVDLRNVFLDTCAKWARGWMNWNRTPTPRGSQRIYFTRVGNWVFQSLVLDIQSSCFCLLWYIWVLVPSLFFKIKKRWRDVGKIPPFGFFPTVHGRVITCDLCLSSVALWMGVGRILDETCPTRLQGKLRSPWRFLRGCWEASGGMLGSWFRGRPPSPFQEDDRGDSPTGEVAACMDPVFVFLPVYRCEIISTTANSSMTAYLLSESSFFVDKNR